MPSGIGSRFISASLNNGQARHKFRTKCHEKYGKFKTKNILMRIFYTYSWIFKKLALSLQCHNYTKPLKRLSHSLFE